MRRADDPLRASLMRYLAECIRAEVNARIDRERAERQLAQYDRDRAEDRRAETWARADRVLARADQIRARADRMRERAERYS